MLCPSTPTWAEVLSDALRGSSCRMHGWTRGPVHVPVADWQRDANGSDRALLRHCHDKTIDVGCGPGRLTHGLLTSGKGALGIDVVPEAVRQARSRGASALRRDVFAAVPGEGRWACALLADGNIGIGGDPLRLLRRVGELVGPAGRAVVDVAPPGSGVRTRRVRIECEGRHSEDFAWSLVGAEAIGALARRCGFASVDLHDHRGRWFAVLHKGRAR